MWYILVTSIIASVNLNFSYLRRGEVGKWLTGWLARFVLIFIGGLLSWWFIRPSFTGPLWGLLGPLSIPLLINCAVTFAFSLENREKEEDLIWAALVAIGYIVVAIAFWWTVPAFQNQQLRNLLERDLEIVRDYPPSAGTDHIRIVPQQSARFDADKLMGNPIPKLGLSTAGSIFKVGELTIQSIPTESGPRLTWVAPLEYRSWYKAWQNPYTPGYVVVDAEDPNLIPRLELGHKLRYVESGFWGRNLHRYIYTHGYQSYKIREITFVIDDEGGPNYVAHLTRPTTGFTGDEVEMILVIDPETGEITRYNNFDTPRWIERNIPEVVVEERLNWWGAYVLGWWNSFVGERNVIKPVGIGDEDPDVYLVHEPTGRIAWVTGFTSKGNDDAALAGVMYVDSRTGKATFYTWVPEDQAPPALSNEDDAYDAVENSLAINSGVFSPAQPIMYRISGRQVYIVPVIAEASGRLEGGIALYDAQAQRTFLDTQYFKGGSKEAILNQYGRWIPNAGTDVDPSQGGGDLILIEGEVVDFATVVVDGNTVFKIVLDSAPQNVFEGADDISPWLWRTKVGQKVRIQYYLVFDTGTGGADTVQSISRFRNVTLFEDQVEHPTSTPVFTPTPVPTATPTPTPGLDDN